MESQLICGSISGSGKRFCCTSKCSDWPCITHPPIKCVSEGLSSGLKWQVRGADFHKVPRLSCNRLTLSLPYMPSRCVHGHLAYTYTNYLPTVDCFRVSSESQDLGHTEHRSGRETSIELELKWPVMFQYKVWLIY
jgi:hypothetical protein